MTIDFDERSPWNEAQVLLIIGPGSAGKSSLGIQLAPVLGRELIDLDIQFLNRIGNIGSYIRDEGYEQYKLADSKLACELKREVISPTILIASSGFLTADNPKAALDENHRLLAECYSLCLLPSRDLEKSVITIVERQMTRVFARDRASEEATIRDRYEIYARLGNTVVFSSAPSCNIAHSVAGRFSETFKLVTHA